MNPKKILIVLAIESGSKRKQLAQLLRLSGYKVSQVDSLLDAYKKIQKSSTGIVVVSDTIKSGDRFDDPREFISKLNKNWGAILLLSRLTDIREDYRDKHVIIAASSSDTEIIRGIGALQSKIEMIKMTEVSRLHVGLLIVAFILVPMGAYFHNVLFAGLGVCFLLVLLIWNACCLPTEED